MNAYVSPLPWQFVLLEPFAQIQDANGKRVQGIEVWLDDAAHDFNPPVIANAEFIVEACSAHHDLIKLISDTMWMIESHEGYSNECDALIDRAREMLARIKP